MTTPTVCRNCSAEIEDVGGDYFVHVEDGAHFCAALDGRSSDRLAEAEPVLTSGRKAARTRAERASARAAAEAELATPEGAARRDALIAELTR